MAAITATVDLTSTPPRVSVDLSAWSADGPVTVQRVHADTSVHEVYMPDVSGGVSQVYDYSAPFSQAVTYQAMDGATQVASSPVTITETGDWLSAPGLPDVVVSVDVDDIGEAEMQRDVAIMASPFRSLPAGEYGEIQGDRRTVRVTTSSASATAGLLSLTSLTGIALVRFPHSDVAWAHVALTGVRRRPVVPWRSVTPDTSADWREWTLGLITVGDPDAAPFGDPTASYQALVDSGMTYQQLLDWKGVGATTYLDVLKGGF